MFENRFFFSFIYLTRKSARGFFVLFVSIWERASTASNIDYNYIIIIHVVFLLLGNVWLWCASFYRSIYPCSWAYFLLFVISLLFRSAFLIKYLFFFLLFSHSFLVHLFYSILFFFSPCSIIQHLNNLC